MSEVPLSGKLNYDKFLITRLVTQKKRYHCTRMHTHLSIYLLVGSSEVSTRKTLNNLLKNLFLCIYESQILQNNRQKPKINKTAA